MVSLTMSVIAMLVCEIVKAFKPYYLVGSLKYSPTFLWLVIVIAPVCGALGGLFRKGFEWAGRHQAKGRQILWQLPLAALVTGIVAIDFPQIMGNGRALAQMAISSRSTTLVVGLLFGAVAKALVTILTLRAGASGGTLAPSIAIGASIGAIMGFAFSLFVPGISIWQCAVLGGCTLLASSQQAPLMALFMMIEVSHLDYSAILPLGLGVCLAVGAAKVCFKN